MMLAANLSTPEYRSFMHHFNDVSGPKLDSSILYLGMSKQDEGCPNSGYPAS